MRRIRVPRPLNRETWPTIVGSKDRIIVHAICLMGNHWHGLIETPLGNVADALHRINWTHACRFNRRHGFRDHVFGTPYHDELIESDAHFLEVVRYIVLNPVRAGLCVLPEQWPWSSFGATAGLVPWPCFLTVDRILAQRATRLRIPSSCGARCRASATR